MRQGENRKKMLDSIKGSASFSVSRERKKNLIGKKTGILDLWRGEKEG